MQAIEASAIDTIQNEGTAMNETAFLVAFRRIAKSAY